MINAATRTRIATRMISTTSIMTMTTTMSATTTTNTVVAKKTLPDAFRNTKLYSDDRIYKLLKFPISSTKVALDLWTKSMTSTSTSSTTITITAPSLPPTPPTPPPFQCFMVDKEEITIIISEYVFKEHFKEGKNNNDDDSDNSDNDSRSNDGSSSKSNSNSNNSSSSSISFDEMGIDYRLITFDDVVLDPNLVGFMAEITKVLASTGNNISVLTYAAYSTDHIFVANKDYTKATHILMKELGISTTS